MLTIEKDADSAFSGLDPPPTCRISKHRVLITVPGNSDPNQRNRCHGTSLILVGKSYCV